MKEGTKGGKLGASARQAYQGLTLGAGDELIDYAALIPAYLASQVQNGEFAPSLEEMRLMARELSQEDLSRDRENAPITSFVANMVGSVPSAVAAGPRMLAQAGLGALTGAASANGGIDERGEGALIGGLLGTAGQLAASGINRVAKGASDLIAPEVRKTAQRLKSLGIPVRLSQLADSKFLSAIDMALSKVPFSGANKSQEAQRKAFTKALSSTFGENADTITDDVLGAAKGRLGKSYDALLKNTDIPIDRQSFAQQLSQLVGDLSLETDDAGAAFLAKQADNILNTIDNNGGVLTGKMYQKLRQTLKGARGTNFSVGQIQKFVDDTVRNSVPDNIGQQLGQIDGQYRNMKIAEKLYGQLQNSTGQIRPETVYNAAKSNIPDLAYGGGGELGDLARVGRLLKPTIPDSGTATQVFGGAALGGAGAGAFFEPTIAAGALGTMGAARGLNRAMTSEYIQQGMRPSIQAGAEALNNSGQIPSLFRQFQMGENAQQSYSPENDPDLQNILNGYDPNNDPELQGMLNGYDADQDQELQKLLNREQTTVPQQSGSLMQRISMAESGGNVNARNPNSSASGEYQFTDPTWRGMVKNYGAQTGITEADKDKPDAQRIMADLLMQENAQAYKNAGFEPNDADLYMAHFLGAPDAVKAKKSIGSGMYAAELFPAAAQANKNVFYDRGRPRTVEDLYQVLSQIVGV